MALTTTQVNHWFIGTQGGAATGLAAASLANVTSEGLNTLSSFTSKYASANADFIEGLYTDILGRASDEEGKAYWEEQLANSTRDEVANNFVFGALNTPADVAKAKASNAAFLENLYQTLFNRASDTEGKAYWEGELAKGLSRSAVEKAFVIGAQDSDKVALNANLNNFIDELYQNLFNRPADNEGKAFWADAMAKGLSKAEIVDEFVKGASEADKATLDNKVAFAEGYTAATPSVEQDAAASNSTSQITAETVDAAALGTANGTADEQGVTPTPQGTKVYVEFDAKVGANIADASNVENATIAYDKTLDPAGTATTASNLSVYTSATTKNVDFDDSLKALVTVDTLTIASDAGNSVDVNGTNLSRLSALTTVRDLVGDTTLTLGKQAVISEVNLGGGSDSLILTGKTENLATITLGEKDQQGDDSLLIQKGAAISDSATISMGAGDDTVTIQKGAKASSVSIDLGNGDDTLAIGADVLVRGASIDFGNGADKLVLDVDSYSLSGVSFSQGDDKGTLTVVAGTAEDDKVTTIADFGVKGALESASGTAIAFELDGDLKLTATSTTSFDISKVEGVVGKENTITLDLSGVSSAAYVVGTDDKNVTDILDLGNVTYSNLSSIVDINVIRAGEKGATISGAGTLKDLEAQIDGEITLSGAVTTNTDLSGLSAFDGEGDKINLTASGSSAMTITLNAEDDIVEKITLASDAYSYSISDKALTIEGAATDDIIAIGGASAGWTNQLASTGTDNKAVLVTLKKEVKDVTLADFADFISSGSSDKAKGYIVADVDDGIAIYGVNSTSLNLLSHIGSAEDDVDFGKVVADAAATFTIA